MLESLPFCSVEDTWRLWQQFAGEAIKLEQWLKERERQVSSPQSENVTVAIAKEELKKYESYQRKIQAHLEHLDSLNNLYRRLARQGLTDAGGRQRTQIYEINSRWDTLNERTAAIVRRLRHTLDVHTDYESSRQALLARLDVLEQQIR